MSPKHPPPPPPLAEGAAPPPWVMMEEDSSGGARRTKLPDPVRVFKELEPRYNRDQLFPSTDASAKAAPAACVVCRNDDPGVSEFQRCDGGCDRWFCIEGYCARHLGVTNYMPDVSGGDLVCGDCRTEQKTITPGLQDHCQESREQ